MVDNKRYTVIGRDSRSAENATIAAQYRLNPLSIMMKQQQLASILTIQTLAKKTIYLRTRQAGPGPILQNESMEVVGFPHG